MALQSNQTSTTTFVDTEDGVRSMVGALTRLPTKPPELYIDLEGTNLCREGTLSIITIHVPCHRHTYIVDITTLKHSAFDTTATVSPKVTDDSSTSSPSTNHLAITETSISELNSKMAATSLGEGSTTKPSTLRTILESRTIPKVFFDVRNDSDALFTHYGVRLNCIHDVQLMELATRTFRKFVHGLGRCIALHAGLDWQETAAWQEVKAAGAKLFDQQRDAGVTIGVFDQRPMPESMLRYCVNDVIYLPILRARYWGQLSKFWRKRVLKESASRVEESQASDYEPQGRQKAEAPPGWWD